MQVKHSLSFLEQFFCITQSPVYSFLACQRTFPAHTKTNPRVRPADPFYLPPLVQSSGPDRNWPTAFPFSSAKFLGQPPFEPTRDWATTLPVSSAPPDGAELLKYCRCWAQTVPQLESWYTKHLPSIGAPSHQLTLVPFLFVQQINNY